MTNVLGGNINWQTDRIWGRIKGAQELIREL